MKTPRIHHIRRAQRSAAFTLIEIILVLSIISLLMGAVIFQVANNIDDAKVIRVKTDIQALTTQLKRYEMSNMNSPSTEQGLQSLVTAPTGTPKARAWRQLMPTVPVDPWDTPYQYRNPGTKNSNGFDIWSLGPDRKESDDDIGNWQTN